MADRNLPSGIDEIEEAVILSVIETLNNRDEKRWFSLFSEGARLSDDGVPRDLQKWCKEELFGRYKARITSIDKVEDGGLTFYARYHSDKWGDFKTFWKFKVKDGKIASLDVGATSY